MKTQDPLFRLVKSLTKSEKRRLSLESSKLGKEDSAYIRLFRSIDRNTQADPDQFKEAIEPNCSRQKYLSTRSRLYKKIRSTLRHLGEEHNPLIELYSLLSDVALLYLRCHWQLCWQLLVRAKGIAAKVSALGLSYEIEIWEIRLFHLRNSQLQKAKPILASRLRNSSMHINQEAFSILGAGRDTIHKKRTLRLAQKSPRSSLLKGILTPLGEPPTTYQIQLADSEKTFSSVDLFQYQLCQVWHYWFVPETVRPLQAESKFLGRAFQKLFPTPEHHPLNETQRSQITHLFFDLLQCLGTRTTGKIHRLLEQLIHEKSADLAPTVQQRFRILFLWNIANQGESELLVSRLRAYHRSFRKGSNLRPIDVVILNCLKKIPDLEIEKWNQVFREAIHRYQNTINSQNKEDRFSILVAQMITKV